MRLRRENCQTGFTYLTLLLGMAIAATALAGAGTVWHTEVRRAKEAQLLFIGEEFKRAIASYYHATPGAAKQLPRKLEDLLRDARYPATRRHLRKIYVDPMTGKAEWGLVLLPEGIHGVHSLSTLMPFKGSDAIAAGRGAAGGAQGSQQSSKRYVDWLFVADLSGTSTSPAENAKLQPGARPTPAATSR